ncbi:MAG: 1-(5-phosphoribosyl)-5-[(5-phosphoribosylamino)methylideneamino]imidazole-4-carboxamide isomerase [Acidobacteria bacterium]|nr:MAG: 1-(5-phosphoribosyl)-5-[(5-phosphoribosylamino)methylideneamino]imidazole-4-carboxamide isomerase [Acidobacteriota bacterium]REK03006.1 MAG: 1-(5-phosphoribosyl)-5-[(5-phosphoribosylamino)methylideneamino]imidazole-4-carboxamide isomerase [Acidobacteriota bacterium]REK13190.1 MAG: 1-(5-phosphoribosyl)-5-[(5-phosphoribosylamino)methylideneamino]imidazole-4-carboxamide isomerase [Acidobacteriota bacterium]REK41184.1 MAG: 1-(5-phosphoribosyl)-5-[(5-phosphoribosylamino)methylideneamino]imida
MIEIIPAIDIIEGRCVRLVQGDFQKKTVYGSDPLDIALAFEAAGISRLHIVDLDGARTGSIANLRVLERIAGGTSLEIDFGGGVSSIADARSVLGAGASIVTVGSAAVKRKDEFLEWIDELGGPSFLLGADVRNGRLAIDGWQTDTEIEIVDYLRGMQTRGVNRAFVTDIARDGLLGGPSVSLYSEILEALPDFELVASGGISSSEDVRVLYESGVSGVIIGKAFYEGLMDAGELVRFSYSLSGNEQDAG